MNQSAAKATRREIRRAFGPQAIDAISETQQNTQATVQSVAFAHQRIEQLIKDLGAEIEKDRAAADDGIAQGDAAQERLFRSLYDCTLWGRLKWLVTGR